MNARVKLVVLLLLAALWPSALWASDPAVTIVWPGTNSRGQVMLTLTTNVRTYTKIVPYGEGSTAASIASSFGAHISMSPSWPVYAKGYPNGTLKMKLKANSSETVTGIQVCVASSGTCVGSPSGTSFQTGNVLPAGPVLEDALYGFIIAKTDGSNGYDGVGNVVAYQDQVNQQWTATYDSLNRLKSASQTILPSQGSAFNIPGGTGVQQYFCWNYDSFGNRTAQIASGASFADTSSCQPSSSAYHNDTTATFDANNRITSGTGITGLTYDAAGNLVEDGNYSYKYDGDGRLCATWRHVTGLVTGYLYDAEGTRIAKGSLTSFSCDLSTNGFTLTNQYIPGPDGQQMTELDSNGNWIHTNIFAGGSLIATDDSAGRHYQLNDWLGNRRMQVDPNGNIEAYYQAAPYGDQLNTQPTTTEHYFTGKERDAESGLDYFGARYMASTMGRFMSPDWSDSPDAVPYANLENPQSLNLYAYAGNNPVSASDADGHIAAWGSASKEVCNDGTIADVCASAKVNDPLQINPATLMQYVKAASNAVSNALQTVSNIVSTSQTLCKLSTTVGGIAGGALTGGEGGAALGAPLGAGFGTFALPGGGTLAGGAAGAGLGAAIGGVGGGIAGGAAGYGLGNAMCSSGSGSSGGGRASGSSARLTNSQQRQTAKYLGMKEVKGLSSQGQAVFEKNGRYFSFSNTSHTAGEVFKEVDRYGNRIATTDLNFNRIGQ